MAQAGLNMSRPLIAPNNTFIDIALGVGELVITFAKSFYNPYAYYWAEWPDDLLQLPDQPEQIMELANQRLARQYIIIILERLSNQWIPQCTIRFNLQGLSNPTIESVTMMELKYILNNPALLAMTRFYEGIGHELVGENLQERLATLGFNNRDSL